MEKVRAVALFGSIKQTASAIGCTRQAVSLWPNHLPRRIADRVIGAAIRLGKEVPPELLDELRREVA